MQQLLDFSRSAASTGFRLQVFEVLNWGTFNRHVWKIPVNSGNSLLTGDIGSGKSTLVDGITTLIVPPQLVTYNKAAGADTRERDLRSYVLGYYKSEKNAETLEANSVALRDQASFSVLLAVFENAGYQSAITLAMVFWISDSTRQPERFYIMAEEALSIQEDFSGFGSDIANLKKKLKQKKRVFLYEYFTKYSAAFMRRMGIENKQALNLFFQTVSMKSVGNLTEFVRRHMLEEPPVRERIDTLCRQFEDLSKAHEAVLRARDQVERLQPLVAEYRDHQNVEKEIDTHQRYRSALNAFFAEIKISLLDERIRSYETEEIKRNDHLEKIRHKLQSLKLHEQELRRAIFDSGGSRLEALSTEIERLTDERDRIKQRSDGYRTLCRKLDITEPKTETDFHDIQQLAEKKLQEVDGLTAEQENRQVEIKVQLQDLSRRISELEAELTSLKKRKSNIPLKSISIRQQLCRELTIDESRIPFCGELLQVRETEKEWEGAAERLLHNFALSLLVPEKLYGRVAAYVNACNLGGRLVYYKTVTGFRDAFDQDTEPRALCRKIEIKPESEFYDWLEQELARRFRMVCCKDIVEFQRLPSAVTQEGQVKGGGMRHEKDDRFAIDDRSRFVLGWQNREKIKLLTRDLAQLQAEWDDQIQALEKADQVRRELRAQEDTLRRILLVRSFAEINWRPLVREIKRLSAEKETLQTGSDILQTLQKQFEATISEIGQWEGKKDKIIEIIGKIQMMLQNWRQNLSEARHRLAEIPVDVRNDLFPELLKLQTEALQDAAINLKNCDARRTEMRDWLQARLDALAKKRDRLAQNTVKLMQAYKHIYPMETREVDAALDAAGEYAAMLDTLIKEDLPRHEAKFKIMLNEGTIQNMALFQSKLEGELADIRDKIQIINTSLAAIDYNEGSYIELVADYSRDMEVRQFRQDLKNCLGGTLAGNAEEDYGESKFLQVKAIIDRFKGREGRSDLDARWTRKVTDVRNWQIFSVSERWKEDGAEKEFFSDTSGKSGGQKEKLAYTILAAALAYQFGLKFGEKRSRSFRFVMIDEAFGRGSDESTRYALELFRKLNLQLLIVTPMQKTHIIEDYVNSVHFIHNEGGKNSMIRNLTIEEYQEEKAAFRKAGT